MSALPKFEENNKTHGINLKIGEKKQMPGVQTSIKIEEKDPGQKKSKAGRPAGSTKNKRPCYPEAELLVNFADEIKKTKKGKPLNPALKKNFLDAYHATVEKNGNWLEDKPELMLGFAGCAIVVDCIDVEEVATQIINTTKQSGLIDKVKAKIEASKPKQESENPKK